jgi:hypothetical protein
MSKGSSLSRRDQLKFPEPRGDTVVLERKSDAWEFGKGALSATFHCAAVLKSERGKRLEVGGRRKNVK